MGIDPSVFTVGPGDHLGLDGLARVGEGGCVGMNLGLVGERGGYPPRKGGGWMVKKEFRVLAGSVPSISHFAWKNAELPGHAETVAVVRARIAAVNFIVLDGACVWFFLVKS